jgi:RNA polymerase sigma-70 factor (ECF subfamily)
MHEPTPGSPTDDELMAACIAGDRRAWAQFVERFSRFVWFMVRATGLKYGVRFGEEACADLHNDLFVALLEDDRRRLRHYEGRNGCSVRSWVRIITVRRTIDALRKRRPELSIEADQEAEGPNRLTPIEPGPDALEHLLQRESSDRRDDVTALFSRLPEADRQLLDLLYVQKLSVPEAAETLGIRHGALYTRKNRLIHKLRDLAVEAGLIDAKAED